MRKIAVCAICHPEHPDLYLYFKRQDDGTHTTPGGHMEPGEAPVEAAIREAKEEVGLHEDFIRNPKLLKHKTYKENGDVLDVYLVGIELDRLPELNLTEDVDDEGVPGSAIWLDPTNTDKELHVPKERNLLIEYLTSLSKSKNLSDIGYRTDHTRWHDLEDHKRAEEEKGNKFPSISHIPGHEAIWVAHNKKDAKRYGNDIRQVNIAGAKLFHSDNDGGYLYIRPKKLIKSQSAADKESEIIKENKEKPENQKDHKFKAAKWTHSNGHPRCIRCGDEERIGGICKPSLNKAELQKAPIISDQPSMSRPHMPWLAEAMDHVKTFDAGTFDIDPNDTNVGHMAGKPLYHHVFKKPDYEHKPGKASFIHALSFNKDPWGDDRVPISASVSGGSTKASDASWAPGTPWKEKESYAQMGEVIAGPGWRSRGLGEKLYNAILKYHGKIASDTSVSPAAHKVWGKVVNQPGVKGKLGPKGVKDVNWAETREKYQDPISTVEYGGQSEYKRMGKSSLQKSPRPLDDEDSIDWQARTILNFDSNVDLKSHKPTKIDDGLFYHAIPILGGKSTYHAFSRDGDLTDPFAYLTVEHGRDYNKASESAVDSDMRGRGFGEKLYLQAIKHHGSMESDDFTTPGSNKIWREVTRNPEVQGHYDDTEDSVHRAKWIGKAESLDFIEEMPDGYVYVCGDGDDAGSRVQEAARSNNLKEVYNISKRIENGSKAVVEFAKKLGYPVIISGGDDLGLLLPISDVINVEKMRRLYQNIAGFSITMGVGPTITQAVDSLLYGKVTGKNKTVIWSPKVSEKLESLKIDQSPEDKVRQKISKYEQHFKSSTKGNLGSELQKMSKPHITFPNLKDVTTRPDQEVQLVETPRQKKIFARKIAEKEMQASDPQKIVSPSHRKKAVDFQQKREERLLPKVGGIQVKTKLGPVAMANAGQQLQNIKGKNAAQEAPEYKEAVENWRSKRNSVIRSYNDEYTQWRKNLRDIVAQASENPNRENAEKYNQILLAQPKKPKLPRKPPLRAPKITEMTPEQKLGQAKYLDAVRVHEGFHYLIDDISRKYGPKVRSDIISGLRNQFDPMVTNDVGGFIAKQYGYKPRKPSFGEETLAQIRDILTVPEKREKYLKYSGEEGPENIKKLKQGYQKAYEWAKKFNVSKSEELEKDRGSIEFPKLNITRQDQEIQNVDTARQKKLAHKKIFNKFKNLRGFRNEALVGEILNTGDDLVAKENAKIINERYGTNLSPEDVQSTGAVTSNEYGKHPIGFVMQEGKSPTSRRRGHEAIHLSLDKIRTKFGPLKHDVVQKYMNNLIHPDVKNMVTSHLNEIGYGPESHEKEIVPHLYEILNDPKTREFAMATSKADPKVINIAKKNWKDIYNFTRKIGEEDLK